MLQIAICEDTPEHARRLAALVEDELRGQRPEVEEFRSPAELLRYIGSGGYAPEIALIGIETDGGGGIALAQRLNALIPACRIIFLSDELRAVTEAYRAEHVWFILRGELDRHLAPALEKSLAPLGAGRGGGLLIRSKGKAVLIPLEEILYLERDCRRTRVQTEKPRRRRLGLASIGKMHRGRWRRSRRSLGS